MATWTDHPATRRSRVRAGHIEERSRAVAAGMHTSCEGSAPSDRSRASDGSAAPRNRPTDIPRRPQPIARYRARARTGGAIRNEIG